MVTKPDLPPAMSVLFLFNHMAEQVGARISATRPDITPNEISLLLHLSSPQRMKDLAQMLTCQPSNMTPLVTRSEQKGWVKKVRSPQDARVVLVELTEEGVTLRQELIDEIMAQIDQVTGMSDDTFRKILALLA